MSTRDGPPSSRRRRGKLAPEDQALWDHVARSITQPLRKKTRMPDVTGTAGSDETLAHLEHRLKSETSLAHPVPSATPRQTIDKPAKQPHPAHPTRQKAPPLADFDRRAVRRIRTGRIEIEARLDLHGMRQDQAHGALRSFLYGCQVRGLRWVLVITGKGRAASDDAPPAPFYTSEERGVLRRSVPRWLSQPDLRPLVVSYTTAALRHGGEGAFYIQLRARRGYTHR
jgi:DNA-nicking Smr family endonuclease